jgi:hypothetical protein
MAALPTVPLGKRGPKSAVAEHPDRATIEIGLANGVGLKTLSARYGVSHSALSAYRKKMSPELLARLRVRPVKSDEELARVREVESRSLLDHLTYIRGRCYANADRCLRIGHNDGERMAMAEAAKVSEKIAKLLGEMGSVIRHDHKHVHLAASPQWHAIRVELVRALRPFPQAHAAAIAAMQRAEAQAGQAPALIEGEAARFDARMVAAAETAAHV